MSRLNDMMDHMSNDISRQGGNATPKATCEACQMAIVGQVSPVQTNTVKLYTGRTCHWKYIELAIHLVPHRSLLHKTQVLLHKAQVLLHKAQVLLHKAQVLLHKTQILRCNLRLCH